MVVTETPESWRPGVLASIPVHSKVQDMWFTNEDEQCSYWVTVPPGGCSIYRVWLDYLNQFRAKFMPGRIHEGAVEVFQTLSQPPSLFLQVLSPWQESRGQESRGPHGRSPGVRSPGRSPGVRSPGVKSLGI